ncbi:MAG: glycoside hydrolase family 5 protein [Spirochaetales bacterium]|nr:glycoside hydrolase family 5 protein [Spirochaetales bacterium]
MRKSGIAALLTVVFLLLFNAIGCTNSGVSVSGGTEYGQLQVKDGKLTDGEGNPVQLRGISTHGLQWFYQLINEKTFDAIKYDWQADIIRLAVYVGENGYKNHPQMIDFVYEGIDLAIARGMYIIVDWHVLNPGNPNDPIYDGAEDFFKKIARKYGKYENVIYEIMNEPNGKVVWGKDLKPYAQKMVNLIRKYDPDNLILIGSSLWSQDVDIAAADPVQGENLMYTVHFYSGTHGQSLRQKVERALNKGVGVFCSEWGTSEANGTGGPFIKKAEEWLAFFDKHNISWVNWSLANKPETSAALQGPRQILDENGNETGDMTSKTPLVPDQLNSDGIPYWPPEQLTESGNFVRARLRGEYIP